MDKKLKLIIVSEEKKLLEAEVDSITAMTTAGEITVLPDHIPLFSTLITGELTFRVANDEDSFVVNKGFIDIDGSNNVNVIVDTATSARDISEQKAKEAMEDAQRTIANSQDRQELLMAEASLKKAMLEIKVAQKSKKNTI